MAIPTFAYIRAAVAPDKMDVNAAPAGAFHSRCGHRRRRDVDAWEVDDDGGDFIMRDASDVNGDEDDVYSPMDVGDEDHVYLPMDVDNETSDQYAPTDAMDWEPSPRAGQGWDCWDFSSLARAIDKIPD
jgi:hypothetical protein